MNYEIVDRVHVAVHGTSDPSDDEWHAYLEHIGAHLDEIDGIVGYTLGGGPNSGHRKYAVEFWKRQRKTPRIAVVTPSMLVVRMAGALRWFMPSQIKAFSVRDLEGAFDYLALSASQRTAAKEAIAKLQTLVSAAKAG
jgi:hypothetical protein